MSEYEVKCECGKSIRVASSQAGSSVYCVCGREVPVPSMSHLRRSAGQTPVPLNAVEHVRQMIACGQLRENTKCPLTGLPVDDEVALHIQCERVLVRHGDAGWWRIFCFTFLFGWVWLLFTRNEQREEFGHDIAVVVPVAVNSQARAQINAMRTQREFRTILATTPAYLRLLEEYPESEISVASSAELL
jgi:hypothetical protein